MDYEFVEAVNKNLASQIRGLCRVNAEQWDVINALKEEVKKLREEVATLKGGL